MSFFNRATTLRAPRPSLSIAGPLWDDLLKKLRERGGGVRESGAFLLGEGDGARRTARSIVLYDDLDPNCLDEGYVRFDGRYYGRLWEICAQESLSVVADVHTHPYGPGQSHSDKMHPMVSIPGHIALIVPDFAQGEIAAADVGVYVYRGRYRWTAYRGHGAAAVLEIKGEEAAQ
jgi:proteasome lid subunit RPN8/RPN11